MDTEAFRTVLFDGVCNLCNGWVDFVIRRDKQRRFRFASLQSEGGRQRLAGFNDAGQDLQSVVLLEDQVLYRRSTAILRILKGLKAPWPAVYYLFIWVPPILRDAVYQWIAKNRYRWFGKRETCRMPTPEEKSLFLG